MLIDALIWTVGTGLCAWSFRRARRRASRGRTDSVTTGGPSAGLASRDGGSSVEDRFPGHGHKSGVRGSGWQYHGPTRGGYRPLSVILLVHAGGSVYQSIGSPTGQCFVIILALLVHIWINVKVQCRNRSLPVPSSGNTSKYLSEYQHSCNGRWMKDTIASDSMDPLCDLMNIMGIKRYALRFIKGSDVEFSDAGKFAFAAFSVVTWFKIRESYGFDGGVSEHRRRDLRRGGMRGTMKLDNAVIKDGKTTRNSPVVTVSNDFGGFRQGTLREEFTWPREGIMEVFTTLENELGRASFKQVFSKMDARPKSSG
jgi:hypothetical protein